MWFGELCGLVIILCFLLTVLLCPELWTRTVDQLCGLVIILCLELEYKNCGCVICAEVTLCG